MSSPKNNNGLSSDSHTLPSSLANSSLVTLSRSVFSTSSGIGRGPLTENFFSSLPSALIVPVILPVSLLTLAAVTLPAWAAAITWL